MNKKELQKLSNEELFKLLNKVDWLDRDLLREYDERKHDGRIKPGRLISPEELENYFRQRREEKERRQKKAS